MSPADTAALVEITVEQHKQDVDGVLQIALGGGDAVAIVQVSRRVWIWGVFGACHRAGWGDGVRGQGGGVRSFLLGVAHFYRKFIQNFWWPHVPYTS